MDYTTFYIADPSLIGSKILNKFSNLIISYNSKSEGDKAIGMVLKLHKANIDCSFMPGSEIESHLKGLSGFISENHLKESDLYYPFLEYITLDW